MPELPEVETVRRGLAPVLEDRLLVSAQAFRPDLRVPFPDRFARRLEGRRVVTLRRRAKYLLADLNDGVTWITHLGMSGSMRITPLPDTTPPGTHDHVRVVTDDDRAVTYRDPRRFGLMTLADTATLERHPLFVHLGPEPTGNAFNGPALAERLAGRRTPLKSALLDQRLVAGLGNIYVCEALFSAGLSPFRQAADVTADEAARLAGAVQAVLARAIAAGGSSLRDHVQASGEMGYFQHGFAVYDRAGGPCPGCDCDVAATGGIARAVQSGRSTFYCPRRQE